MAHGAGRLAEKAVEFIERDRSSPFLIYLPHKAIHPDLTRRLPDGQSALISGGFLAAPRHEGRYDDADIPRSPSYGVPPTDKPALMRDMGMPPLGPDTVTPDETIRDRLEMLLSIDDGVGTSLEALERTGQLDNTMVIVAGDHGYFYGEHGLNAERRLGYEESVRIPVVVRYPDLIPAGMRPDQLAPGSNSPRTPTGRLLVHEEVSEIPSVLCPPWRATRRQPHSNSCRLNDGGARFGIEARATPSLKSRR